MSLTDARRILRSAHPLMDVVGSNRRGHYLWLLNGQPLVLTTFGYLEDLVPIIREVAKRYA
jgi:hypothetical protein